LKLKIDDPGHQKSPPGKTDELVIILIATF